MEYDLILQNVARHITMDERETAYFTSLLQPKKLRKRQYLLQEGDICRSIAFVNKGCLSSYSINHNGHEHITQFAIEGWWISDMYSFISQKPAVVNIYALEHCEILLISKTDLEQLFIEVPRFERFFRILAENAIVAHQIRIRESATLLAAERYSNFISKYPFFAQRLPQTQIAAYLGVTPEFLSKIRNEQAKQSKSLNID